MAKSKAEIVGEYKRVPLAQLREREDNPNRQSKLVFSKLVSTIRTKGFRDPIICRTRKGYFEILGGAHRARAAAKLGMVEVPIIDLGAIDDIDARQTLINLNELRGASDQDAMAALIQGLKDDGGDEAMQDLPFTDAQLVDFLDDQADDSLPDEEAEPPAPDERDVKIRPADLVCVLELEGLKTAQLKAILAAFRKWRQRTDMSTPAWELLLALIKKA